jgi:diacylglycerol kinase family enzyme
MKHVFVFDPKAFHNQQWKMDNIHDNIGQFFRTQVKPDFSVQQSRYRRNAMLLIQEEAEKAKPGDIIRIYAVGGEEILFDCLNGIAHYPDMQLVAMPHGETNDFIRIFGDYNLESFKDIPSLVKAQTLSTDIIRWGVNYALNSCYIGMNSAISKKLKDLKSSINKSSFIVLSKFSFILSYIIMAFDKSQTRLEYKITIDDVDYSGHYSLIHVANGPYYAGRLTGASEATPNDGLFDIALLKATHPLEILFSMRKYFRGKRPKNCILVQGKKITIHCDSQMWIQLDNEYIQDTDISLNLIPQAVQLVALDNLSYPLASIPAL